LANAAEERFPDDSGVLAAVGFARLFCENDPLSAAELATRINITTVYEVTYAIDLLLFAGNFELASDRLTSLSGQLSETPFNRQVIATYQAFLYHRAGKEGLATKATETAAAAFAETEQPGIAQLAWAALTFALKGDKAETLKLGQRALDSLPDDAWLEANFRYWVLRAYAQAGASKEALEQFAKMWNAAGGKYITVPGLDPFLEPLRRYPGFEEIMAGSGAPE
jgi:tetratricopeptide (TPR) repeat protein